MAHINGTDDDTLPRALSPSRAAVFAKCPAEYYLGGVRRLREPSTDYQLVGTLAHYAYEHAFDLPADQRDEETVVAFVQVELDRMRAAGEEQHLIGTDEAAREIGDRARDMVRNWFGVERVNNFEPVGREMVVSGDIGGGVDIYGIIDRVDRVETTSGDVNWYISDYKGLAIDTPLPTPRGWTTMAQVAVGDQLIGADGSPTTVTVKSGVHHRPCYKITFDDQSTIVCDNVHLWEVEVGEAGSWDTRVVDAGELARLARKPELTLRIPNTTVDLPARQLPVDPYLYGLWLACGVVRRGTLSSGSDEAQAVSDKIAARGYTDSDVAYTTLRNMIKQAGMMAGGIPVRYLRGDVSQRRALLDGILSESAVDGDGTITFTTRDRTVADATAELACSLGGTAATTLSARVAGRHGHVDVTYTTRVTLPSEGRLYRTVVAVDDTASVPTQCVKVDAADSLYLAGRQMVPTHNTGKVPSASSMYLDEKFFQLRTYALVLYDRFGIIPAKLRLIYTARGKRDDVRSRPCDKGVLERTRAKLRKIYAGITEAQEAKRWQCKPQKLCNWCAYKPVCPAHNEAFADGDPVRISEAFNELVAAKLAGNVPLEAPGDIPVAVPVTVTAAAGADRSSGIDGLPGDYTGPADNW